MLSKSYFKTWWNGKTNEISLKITRNKKLSLFRFHFFTLNKHTHETARKFKLKSTVNLEAVHK